MNSLVFRNLNSILCLGCHADDIEIGCGGTLLRLIEQHPEAEVTWIVLSADGVRKAEAHDSAERFLSDAASQNIIVRDFRDRFFPQQAEQIKDFLHGVSREVSPDVVFTHRLEDRHQDHRLIAELTWQAFRNHLVMEYEIPKYEGDLGQPNVYVPLSEEICDRKIETIYTAFASQQDKPWFTRDTFRALLRLRGIECHSPSRFAEGLYCRKLVL